MENKVAAFAATPDPTFGQKSPSLGPASAPTPRQTGSVADQADLRLVIEEDQASGSYIYKTVVRQTGEIIQQLPRAELLKLRDTARYAAGVLIRTKA
jgi:flagellar protein FlaG